MKTKLQILIAVLSIAFSVAKGLAQQPAPTPVPIDPQTGLPEAALNIDPATGLPADGSAPFKDTNGVPTWINPLWEDPGKALTSVQFSDLPSTEVARYLLKQFTNYFDIIIPNPNGVSEPARDVFDPTKCSINLQLKNVTATEILSAMNLQFELENKPVRWELTLNGSRPTVLLRFLPQLVPAPPPPPPQTKKAFYVGDMLDDYSGTNDASKLDSIAKIVRDTGGLAVSVKMYPPGQLLIVSGTPDQVDLAEQTLRALKDKADFERSHPQPQK